MRRLGRPARVARKAIIVLDAIVLGGLALAAATVGGVWWYARTAGGQAHVARIVERALHHAAPGVRLQGVGTNGDRDVVITNVDFLDPEGARAVHADKIVVHPHWSAVVRGRVDLDEVRVEGLNVDARTMADGRLNLTALVPASPGAATVKAATPEKAMPWTVRHLTLVDGRGQLHGAGGVVAVSSVALTAQASGDADQKVTVTLENLDTMVALPGQPVRHASIRGSAVLAGGAVDAAVDELRLAGLISDHDVVVRANVRKNGETVTSAGAANAGAAGGISWSGTATLGAEGLGPYQLRARVDRLMLGALPVAVPPGRLSARLAVEGAGVPLQPGSRAVVTVNVDDSMVSGYRIDELALAGDTRDRRWTLRNVTAHVAGIAGRASGSGSGDRGRAQVTVDVDRPTARGAALAPSLPVTGRGHVVATVDGRWPDSLHFQVKGSARRLAIAHQLTVEAATVELAGTATQGRSWSVTTRGRATVARLSSSALTVDGATLALAARGPVTEPEGSVILSARQLVLPQSDLHLDTARFEARGTAGHLEVALRAHGADGDADLQAMVRRHAGDVDVTFPRASFDVHRGKFHQKATLASSTALTLRLRDDALRIAGLHLVTQGMGVNGELSADGTMAWPGHVRTAATGHLVLALRHATTANVPPLDVDVVADLGDGQARAEVAVAQTNGAARLNGHFALPLTHTPAGLGWKLAATGAVQATVDSSNIDLATIASLQRLVSRWGLTGGLFKVHLAVGGDMKDPDASVALDVRRLEYRSVSGQGRDSEIHRVPRIGVSVKLATAPQHVRVQSQFLLYDGGFATSSLDLGVGLSALLRGSDPRQAPLDATLDVPHFQIGALRSVSDQLADTTGWLTAHAHVTGTLTRPVGTADLSLADAHLDQINMGLVTAHAEADGRHVHGVLRIPTPGTGLLVAQGDVILAAPRRLTGTLDMSHVDPGFVRPLVPGLRELGGVIDAHVVAAGTLAQPALTGRLYYYRGRVGVVGEPTFTDVGLAVTLAPDRIDIDTLQAYSGGGSLNGKGQVTLAGQRVSAATLTARAHRFVVAAAGVSGSRLDGDLNVTIVRNADTLNGDAHVPNATVWLPGLSVDSHHPQRITPHDDVRFVDGASQAAAARNAAAPSTPTRLNLKARADTVFVRAKDLDLELDSQLSIRSTAKGDDALNGVIHVRRGRINISGQAFDFDDGRITFDGSTTPRLDLRLTRAYPDATITIELRGTAEKPLLRFRSDPAIYDESQIISLVLTGKVGGAPGGPSPDPTAVIATTVLRTVADKLAPQLGLDVFKVERTAPPTDQPNATPGLLAERVEVGKYVSERVYVSYAHVFGATESQNSNEAQAEYHISPRWLAQTVFGDAGVGGFDAFWTYRY